MLFLTTTDNIRHQYQYKCWYVDNPTSDHNWEKNIFFSWNKIILKLY